MNVSLHFLEHDVAIPEDSWTALTTTGSDHTLANVRATILGVLEREGAFTIEGGNGQVVRRIDTASEFEGFMEQIERQRDEGEPGQA